MSLIRQLKTAGMPAVTVRAERSRITFRDLLETTIPIWCGLIGLFMVLGGCLAESNWVAIAGACIWIAPMVIGPFFEERIDG